MAEVTKFLVDDHTRIRRSFNDYERTRNDLDAALNVCDLLRIHLTIEAELVHPVVSDALSAADTKAVDDADAQMRGIMEAVENLKPDDASLGSRMISLQRAFRTHVETYTTQVRPKLAGRDDEMEMGSQAFRRWQQLVEDKAPRTWTPMNRLANTGWGGGGKIANSGW